MTGMTAGTQGNRTDSFVTLFLERHATSIRSAWLKRLSLCRCFVERGLLELIEQQGRTGTDLVSLWLGILATGKDGLDFAKDQIVPHIRDYDYSISDFYLEVTSLKEAFDEVFRASSRVDQPAAQVQSLDTFRTLDELFGVCLKKTSLIYETAVERSARGYCQVDNEGIIVSTNRAFSELTGHKNVEKMKLSDLFLKGSDFVKDALEGKDGEEPVIRRMALERAERKGPVPVLAELGPLIVDGVKRGGYATFTNISPIAEAELEVFERSQRAIVKTDPDFTITYANKKAVKLFGLTVDKLKGMKYNELFSGEKNQRELKKQFRRRSEGKGSAYELTYERPSDHRVLPLTIDAMPEYGNKGERTGALGIIRNRDIEEATKSIHQIVETETENLGAMLTGVLKVVQKIVPFDMATVGAYTDDMEYWRAFHYHPKPDPMWETYWWPVDPRLRDWMSAPGAKIVNDLKGWLKKTPGAESLELDPTTKRVLKEGYGSFLALPIRVEGRIVATLSLIGRKGRRFFPKQHDLLTQLPVGKAIAMALYLREREEVDFFHNLIRQLSKCDDGTPPSAEKVAEILTRELSCFYEWQNVSIFKVNEVRDRFELVAQGKGPQKGFRLPKNYWHRIGRGILGEVYRSKEPVIVSDVRKGQHANIYIASRKATKSELCMPIRIHGKIVWLLNLEDSRFRAFCQADLKTLDRIIDEVESFLEALFTRTTLEEVLEVSHDGIIVTDLVGRIKSINRAAAKMLKVTASKAKDPKDLSFTKFVANPVTRDVILAQNPINTVTETLIDARGGRLKTRMSSRDLPTGYFGGRVFFLEDLKHAEQLEIREAKQGALYEIATQTRMPLSLASSLLRKLERGAEEVQRELAGKALHQLSKAEIVFERLMLLGDASEPYRRKNAVIEIRELMDYVRDRLPAEDAQSVRVHGLESVPAVNGDFYQLTFVLQSLVNYFLRFKPADENIVVEAIRNGSDIWISVTGVVGDDYRIKMEGDHFDPCRTARAEVALGHLVLERFIETNHGGSYEAPSPQREGWETARIRLPVTVAAPAATVNAG